MKTVTKTLLVLWLLWQWHACACSLNCLPRGKNKNFWNKISNFMLFLVSSGGFSLFWSYYFFMFKNAMWMNVLFFVLLCTQTLHTLLPTRPCLLHNLQEVHSFHPTKTNLHQRHSLPTLHWFIARLALYCWISRSRTSIRIGSKREVERRQTTFFLFHLGSFRIR